ncbi:NHL repeat-containing protein [Paenibacillus sp. 1_12]|uniref:hypothetical protein n=1 Tax=Paenibacillus sp. 1_12 TaxID=1566278 RepID=UPI0008EACBE2|nr:hypothetical protein [Paenibacillus sp. 1_12]SFM50593.1 NHL repeat-containing protein [Paenibacillus sp. 1_12]
MRGNKFAKWFLLFISVVFACTGLLSVEKAQASTVPDLEFIKSIGSGGSGDGQFNRLHASAVDSKGNLYVADSYNHRIQKFAPDGTFLKRWGKDGGNGNSGVGHGEFLEPLGIAIDSKDHVFVTEAGNFRVQQFDSEGNYIRMWEGGAGDAADKFNIPLGIVFDTQDNMYVVEGGEKPYPKV